MIENLKNLYSFLGVNISSAYGMGLIRFAVLGLFIEKAVRLGHPPLRAGCAHICAHTQAWTG